MPSWKRVIVSGSAAHVLNITASNLPNLYKNHVLMYDTASGAVTYWTSSLEPPSNTVQLMGTVRYDNGAQTPMTNTTVRLIDSSGIPYTSVITNASGDFNFGFNIPIGNYYVHIQTNKPWGGTTSSDSLRILQHINGNSLTGIRKLAADVNGDDTINGVDISLIMQAFLSSPANVSGYKGEWVFGSGSGENFRGWYEINAIGGFGGPAIPNGTISPSNGAVSSFGIPLTASADNTNLQYLALCLGDVDGSYTPNVNL
jgi:hypothetical protein